MTPDDRDLVVLARTMFEDDAASRRLGITLTHLAAGCAEGTMTVRDDMLNGHGTCHGGYIFLFADTVFSCVCNSHGVVTVAAQADIVYVAPVLEGDVLTARAEERLLFGRNGMYDVIVRNQRDDVVAAFRGHSRASRVALDAAHRGAALDEPTTSAAG